MKRIVMLTVSALLAVGLAACNSESKKEGPKQQNSTSATQLTQPNKDRRKIPSAQELRKRLDESHQKMKQRLEELEKESGQSMDDYRKEINESYQKALKQLEQYKLFEEKSKPSPTQE